MNKPHSSSTRKVKFVLNCIKILHNCFSFKGLKLEKTVCLFLKHGRFGECKSMIMCNNNNNNQHHNQQTLSELTLQ